jgi:hypothetical protein
MKVAEHSVVEHNLESDGIEVLGTFREMVMIYGDIDRHCTITEKTPLFISSADHPLRAVDGCGGDHSVCKANGGISLRYRW